MKANRLTCLAIATAFLLATIGAVAHAETFVVNSTGAGADGACEPAPDDCTLREAMDAANQSGGGHTVSFAGLEGAGPWTFSSSSITINADNTLIDGTTAPGWTGTPLVQIRAPNAGRDLVRIRSDGNTVRGLILSTFFFGVEILGHDNHVAGNWIGLDVTGSMLEAGNSAVSVAGNRNVIGVNGDGVDDDLEANYFGSRVLVGPFNSDISEDNTIAGNFFGTDATGTIVLGGGGIALANTLPGTLRTTIGTNGDGVSDHLEGNVIAGATPRGITISGGFVGETIIAGNRIGVGLNNCAMPSGTAIDVQSAASAGLIIGGDTPAEQNIIGFNTGPGIRAFGDTSIFVRGNALFRNGGRPIDLHDAGDNDPGDIDEGANGLQNWPVLDAVAAVPGATQVDGFLDSESGLTFELRFYASSTCRAGLEGEGEIFLGADVATTAADGTVSFSALVDPVDLQRFPFVSATATHPDRGTSEFSTCITPQNDVLFKDLFESLQFRCATP